MRYDNMTRTTRRGRSICENRKLIVRKGQDGARRLKMVRSSATGRDSSQVATQKDRYVSPFLPRLQAPPVPPPPPSPSSSTEDDGVLYSLQPQFAASSISLSFSFSPGCPGMNSDARERREEVKSEERKKERERERDLAENTG